MLAASPLCLPADGCLFVPEYVVWAAVFSSMLVRLSSASLYFFSLICPCHYCCLRTPIHRPGFALPPRGERETSRAAGWTSRPPLCACRLQLGVINLLRSCCRSGVRHRGWLTISTRRAHHQRQCTCLWQQCLWCQLRWWWCYLLLRWRRHHAWKSCTACMLKRRLLRSSKQQRCGGASRELQRHHSLCHCRLR